MEEIKILNLEELEQQINNNSKLIVVFYYDWCPICRILIPNLLDNAKDDYVIGTINTTKSTDILDKYPIQNFPTIFLYHNKKLITELVGYYEFSDIEKYYL